MMSKETGGPAFPFVVSIKNHDGTEATAYYGGMTLRDYFAAKAMQGLCAGFSSGDEDDWPDDRTDHYQIVSEHAYCIAAAMIKARGE